MSVYVTGDTHGGFQRLGMKYFPEQKKMNREDRRRLWRTLGWNTRGEVLAGLAGGQAFYDCLLGWEPRELCHAERAAGKVVARRQDP